MTVMTLANATVKLVADKVTFNELACGCKINNKTEYASQNTLGNWKSKMKYDGRVAF